MPADLSEMPDARQFRCELETLRVHGSLSAYVWLELSPIEAHALASMMIEMAGCEAVGPHTGEWKKKIIRTLGPIIRQLSARMACPECREKLQRAYLDQRVSGV